MFGIKVRWSKKFAPSFPQERLILGVLGKRASEMIEQRIRVKGKDADGKAIPPLAPRRKPGRWWYIDAEDLRFRHLGRDYEEARKNPPKRPGDTVRAMRYKGSAKGRILGYSKQWPRYADAKRDLGGKDKRDLSLTGTMWRSMYVSVTGNQKKRKVKISFGGSDKKTKKVVIKNGVAQRTAKGKVKRRSIRNRDKARLAMFPKKTPAGAEKGRQLFDLMRLSKDEMRELQGIYSGAIRLFDHA